MQKIHSLILFFNFLCVFDSVYPFFHCNICQGFFHYHLTSFILNVLFFLATSPLTFAHTNSIAFSSECVTGNRRTGSRLIYYFFYSILLLPVQFQSVSVHRAPSPSAIIVEWCHLCHKQCSYSLANPAFFLFPTCIRLY